MENGELLRTSKKLKYNIYVFSFISIFIILIASVLYILVPRGKPIELLTSDGLFEFINDGDIICRLGNRFWSQIFKETSNTDKRYSHLGIIRIRDGVATVIHSEGTTGQGKDFVKEQPIDDFLQIARAIGIYRAKNVDGAQISDTSREYLGRSFDWKFDLKDASEVYCTELLYLVLSRLMSEIELKTIYLKELGRDIIPLEAISNSDYFSEIYYRAH